MLKCRLKMDMKSETAVFESRSTLSVVDPCSANRKPAMVNSPHEDNVQIGIHIGTS